MGLQCANNGPAVYYCSDLSKRNLPLPKNLPSIAKHSTKQPQNHSNTTNLPSITKQPNKHSKNHQTPAIWNKLSCPRTDQSAPARNRTSDPLITSPTPNQLSYFVGDRLFHIILKFAICGYSVFGNSTTYGKKCYTTVKLALLRSLPPIIFIYKNVVMRFTL